MAALIFVQAGCLGTAGPSLDYLELIPPRRRRG
jgi:hypothetical protein